MKKRCLPLANNVLEEAAGMEEGSRIFAASAALVIASVGVLIFFAFSNAFMCLLASVICDLYFSGFSLPAFLLQIT
ncbi:MAG: hypothetical protein HFI00_18265 [Lachnospiraceae bacterium]|jgi:hypothetical protein|nr:hypothetical protein [Lachnospiraceae bacterium]